MDQKFEEQKTDNLEVKKCLLEMNQMMKMLVERRTNPESATQIEDARPGPSGLSKKSQLRRSKEKSMEKSTSSSNTSRKESKKRDRTPSPGRNSKRSRKSKEERTTRKDSAAASLREQQLQRNDFTNAVTSLPKWLTDEADINPIGYIAARFGFVHEECRAYARSRNDKGQTYEQWRNYFHGEAHRQVKDFDESCGRMFYTLRKAGKKPTLKLIVPKWFKRLKNRPVAQINPATDVKNLLVWHTDIVFLDNFFLDCGGEFY